jgi:thioredoxin-related protein
VKYLIISVVAAIGVGAVLLATQKEKSAPVSDSQQPAESLWLTDYKQAQEQAKVSNKPLLLEFTGSDWCPPCRQLQKQILSTPTFQQYAKDNFVLVELDYPRARVQAPEVAQQNQILAHRFQIEVFPTVIILNSDGKKIGELIGFDPHAGPEGYIASLEKFRKG